jgi:hypothetical protein
MINFITSVLTTTEYNLLIINVLYSGRGINSSYTIKNDQNTEGPLRPILKDTLELAGSKLPLRFSKKKISDFEKHVSNIRIYKKSPSVFWSFLIA